ncbi:MAG: T9SS type A sorting domain-containing protein [Crocinitomicaceae bacterium]|nr:T9SS type A sorting domain-containing protein [Crocinitomicaceae bacterium]
MKQVFFTLFCAFHIPLIAQNYFPIPEANTVWIQASFLYSVNGHEHSTITNPISFGPDTTMNNHTYHTLVGHEITEWIDGLGNPQNYATGTYTTEGYQFYFRQDIATKKVYTFKNNQDTLLYDFNLSVGQIYPATANNSLYPQLKVMHQDSVLLPDGFYHKKWQLGTNSLDSGYISLIEGVGATSGFSLDFYPQFEQASALLCMRTFSEFLYENWNFTGIIPPKYSDYCDANLGFEKMGQNNLSFEVYPNPVTEELNLLSSYHTSENVTIKVCTIDGLEIKKEQKVVLPSKIDVSYLQKGIYFILIDNEHVIRFIKN